MKAILSFRNVGEYLPNGTGLTSEENCIFISRKLKSWCILFDATNIYIYIYIYIHTHTYKVIRTPLLDFRPLRYSSRDGHAEGEHVNRGRDIPNFCPTLQVLDVSTLGDAADVNPVIKFLPNTLVLCGNVAACCSMSTEGKTLQVSVLPYRCSMCPPLVTRQMSIL